MGRSAFQVLVVPYARTAEGFRYLALRRSDLDYWQWIAGGGELGESTDDAAIRECTEEIGLSPISFKRLDSMCMLPKIHFKGNEAWQEKYVIPEYSYAALMPVDGIRISREHSEYRWVSHQEALGLLKWDSNRTALWELSQRLNTGDA